MEVVMEREGKRRRGRETREGGRDSEKKIERERWRWR
jgi:hypothetical protein